MAVENTVEATYVTSVQGDMSGRVKRVALAVPALSLPMGIVAMVVEPRFGLFETALVLGWAQLVGL
jgi:hypothetical protein